MTESTPSRVAQGAGATALLLLACALGIRPYLGTLGHDPMALDSVYWIVRSSVTSEGWAAWTFGGPHFIAYRPVAALSFSLTSLFAGLEPLSYRLFDVFLHAANGALVFAVARRLAPAAPVAIGLLAAAVFLGHPAAEEVVPWLARRHNALGCAFSLLAIHALLGALTAPRRTTTGFAAAGWLAIALLSNEVAFTTAAALPLLAIAVGPPGEHRASLRAALPALAVSAFVLALRLGVLGGVGGYTPEDAGIARFLRVLLAFWRDLLSFDLAGAARGVAVIAAAASAVAFAAAALRTRLHLRLLTVLLGWLLGASLLLAFQQVWFPRELYALLPAFALLVAFGLHAALRAWPAGAARLAAGALVGLYLACLLFAGWTTQPGRTASWQQMQARLDELRAALGGLPDGAELLLASRYADDTRPRNPLRARPPRPGPPRSERIPALWLSAQHSERGISVRDAVSFPASHGDPVRFERIGGRPALLYGAERQIFLASDAERSERDGDIVLWLDSFSDPRRSERWVFLRDEPPGKLIALGGAASPARPAAAPAASPARPAAAPAASPVSVLLIVVDTLRRDHLGAYGYARDTSPNIDRLASEGVRYQRALAAAPWTTPSVASLLTSRLPAALGISDVDSKLDDDAILLSERLRAHGLRTGAVVSHHFVSERWGFDQGFDFFDDDNALDHDAVTSAAVSDRAIAFLDETGDRPFFLLLHYFDPHFAYLEHTGFDFPREEPYTGPARPGVPFGELLKQQGRLVEADAAELVRRYDSEIRFTDHHIGRVLDHLRERGQLDRTLVVLTADHGEEFLEHGRLGHTKTLYDEVVGVPLIVRMPGVDPTVVEDPVALVDVVPTILEALAVPIPDDLEGLPLGATSAGRFLFTSTDRRQPKRAAVGRDRKRIHDLRTGRYEEFDLLSDPREQRPSEGADPALSDALERFEQRLIEEHRVTPGLDLSPEERERLRLLGYGESN